ncbi:unnamed protein product [Vicia faba]|uniref:Uncharacterized protein n=1 Tax=Vicia faba TaxID=3906 RepID=A0AAV0Z4W2_VICFA|nr:unnamed protein product [Vicia faba]
MRVVLTAIIPWDYASQGSSQRKQYKERSEKEEEVMEFEAIYLSEKVRCLLKRSEAMTNQRSSGNCCVLCFLSSSSSNSIFFFCYFFLIFLFSVTNLLISNNKDTEI